MDPVQRRARGIRAQQILDDEILVEALNRLEADAVDALASADLSDGQALIRHAAELKAARTFRDDLKSLVQTGERATTRPTAVA